MDNAEQPMDLAKKVMELAGGELRFKHDFNTPEELLAVGAYNNAELERIEAIGTEVPDRIWDLISLLMAEALQPVIMNSEDPKGALRQFLLDKFFQPKYGWEKHRQLARDAFAASGFTSEQLGLLYQWIDSLPYLMIAEIVESVIHLCVIPNTESNKFTGILVEMFKEARNVDHS